MGFGPVSTADKHRRGAQWLCGQQARGQWRLLALPARQRDFSPKTIVSNRWNARLSSCSAQAALHVRSQGVMSCAQAMFSARVPEKKTASCGTR